MRPMLRLGVCVLASLTLQLPTAWAQSASPKLGSGVRAELDAAGAAEVLVLFREPPMSSGLNQRRRALAAQHRAVLAKVAPQDVQVHRQFALVGGFVASVTSTGLAALLADPAVVGVDGMRGGSGAEAESLTQIRADAVHARDDLGAGATVAVLDTGVDLTHPDLAGSIIAEQCFCSGNCCPDGSRAQAGPGSALTTYVHGIHVTGTIVSKGIVAPEGVAPAAKVVAVKVLDDQNRGLLVDWISALDWIANDRPDVQAINMSLVSDQLYAGQCDTADLYTTAFARVLGLLRARGTLAFVASGNTGRIGQMPAAACVDAAVAVGAVTHSDTIWQGTDSDAVLDLLAPGVAIVSAGTNDGTATLTGTSMATAHATGTAALLLAINPDLGADALEAALKHTGVPILDQRNQLTFPRIDARAALDAVWRLTPPITGGSSRFTDCLTEWDVPGAALTRSRVTRAVCRDGDPVCDSDQTPGQCTLQVAACFNVPDRRLPRCQSDVPIIAERLLSPSGAHAHDDFDAANATALAAALPPVPIAERNRCTDYVAFIVPAGQERWIRFSARAADGRVDSDRLRLSCFAAQP